MRHEIIYLTEKKPEISVIIGSVTEGVYLIYCDFYERLSYDGMGSGSDNSYSIYFGNEDEILIELKFYPKDDGLVFCDMSKKTCHGMFFTNSAYQLAMSKQSRST